ncbi:FecR family protein [Pedobacter africanus]
MGTITDAEKKELGAWLNNIEEKPLEIPGDRAQDKEQYGEHIFQRIREEIGIQSETQTPKLWPKIVAVAAAVSIMVLGVFFFNYRNSSVQDQDKNNLVLQYIAPGKQGATLTLASGTTIKLSDTQNGELAKQAGVTITKTKEGQLVYEIKPSTGVSTDLGAVNTLTTARGETYKVKLPDGTEVWLNAASSIRYAANLLESGKRKVSLQGEAYFQVAKDKAHPFVVKSGNQEVEVLGTQFNINAYKSTNTKTTLLEGSVKLAYNAQQKILLPNQQATTGKGDIAVKDIDGEFAVAWKNGFFMFDSERLEDIMEKLSRWYNVEVEFTEPALKNMTFFGTVSKSENISKVLKALERTKSVTFIVENNKVIIKRK